MAVNDVYQLVDEGVMYGQKMLNVYFFQQTGSPSGLGTVSEDLTNAFIDQLLPKIAACQSSDFVHQSIRTKNLFNVSDAFEALISVAGDDGNPADTAFDAVGFRLVGDNAAVRSGAKRLPALADSAVTEGVITGSGEITTLNTLASALDDILTFGVLTVATWTPVIVKRLLVGGEYVLPDTLADAVISVVVDALWNTLVTTQTSRKVGRGE